MAVYKPINLAKKLGVSRAAISKAIKAGNLELNDEKLIDDEIPVNTLYIERVSTNLINKIRRYEEKSNKELDEKLEEQREELVDDNSLSEKDAKIEPEIISMTEKVAKKYPKKIVTKTKRRKRVPKNDPKIVDLGNSEEIFSDKNHVKDLVTHGKEIDNKIKEIKLSRERVKYYEDIGKSIPLDVVARGLAKVSAVISEQFGMFPDRHASELYAMSQIGESEAEFRFRLDKYIQDSLGIVIANVEKTVRKYREKEDRGTRGLDTGDINFD